MRAVNRIENIFITFFYTLGITGFVLIRMNSFHPSLQIISSILITTAVSWFWKRIAGTPDYASQAKEETWWPLCLVAIFCITFFNALFPACYMLGDRDTGLYFLFSVVISKTGSLNLNLPQAAQAASELQNLVSPGYPGIYDAVKSGFSKTPGDLMPQFAHLFCAYGALSHSLFGIEGLIRTNAVIGLFAMLSFAKVLKKLLPGWLVPAGIIILGLNPAFMWNSRQTLTETLSIFILFSSILLMQNADRKRPGLILFAAGTVMASGILNRVDTLINSVIVAAFVTVSATRWEKKNSLALPAAFVIFCAIGMLDGFISAGPYYKNLWNSGTLAMLVALYLTIIPASIVIFIASRRKICIPKSWLSSAVTTGAILLGAWICFRFFPGETHPSENAKRAVRELGWYIMPLSYPLILAGIHLSARDKNTSLWIPIAVMCGVSVFIFTWQPYAWPDHFWTSRRWLTHVIPFGTIITLYTFNKIQALSKAHRNKTKIIIILIIVCMLGNSFYVSRTFATRKLLEDYPADLENIAETLNTVPYGDYLVSNAHQLASYLTYIYGHPTILLSEEGRNRLSAKDDCELLNGRYFIGIPFLSRAQELETRNHFLVKGAFPEQAVARIPEKLENSIYYYEMGRITSGHYCNKPHILLAMDNRLQTTPASIKDISTGQIVSTGKAGFLQYGPYIPLDPGSYKVTWTGSLNPASTGELGYVDVNICADKEVAAKAFLTAENVVSQTLAEISFTLDEPAKEVEFRFFVNEDVGVLLDKVTLERTGP